MFFFFSPFSPLFFLLFFLLFSFFFFYSLFFNPFFSPPFFFFPSVPPARPVTRDHLLSGTAGLVWQQWCLGSAHGMPVVPFSWEKRRVLGSSIAVSWRRDLISLDFNLLFLSCLSTLFTFPLYLKQGPAGQDLTSFVLCGFGYSEAKLQILQGWSVYRLEAGSHKI